MPGIPWRFARLENRLRSWRWYCCGSSADVNTEHINFSDRLGLYPRDLAFIPVLLHRCDGHREQKVGTLAGFRLYPNAALGPLENAFTDGQSHSGPAGFCAVVEAFENAEDLVVICRINADTVILHGESPETITAGGGKMYPRNILAPILDCIRD
jgi:hypothetical protein